MKSYIGQMVASEHSTGVDSFEVVFYDTFLQVSSVISAKTRWMLLFRCSNVASLLIQTRLLRKLPTTKTRKTTNDSLDVWHVAPSY